MTPEIKTRLLNKSYTYHQDPSHGWLEVPAADARAAGVEGVSVYSYASPTSLFLEEDCDIARFLACFGEDREKVRIVSQHSNQDSFVRSLSCVTRQFPEFCRNAPHPFALAA